MRILSGIDIVDNSKIKKLIDKSVNSLTDIFSDREIRYCKANRYPEQSFGVRFAAKEAIIKAVDSGILKCSLSEIEILNTHSGKPVVNLKDKRLVDRISRLLKTKNFDINVSLSHEKDYSIAQVIIYPS